MRTATLAGVAAVGLVVLACPSQAPVSAEAPDCPACPACPESVQAAPTPEPVPEPAKPALKLTKVPFADVPDWDKDRHAEAVVAFRRSCQALMRRAADRPIGVSGIGGTTADWKAACRAAKSIGPADHARARAMFEREFVPYLAANNDEQVGRFTGYYEATMRGSKRRHGKYQTPLYSRPKDLVPARLNDFWSDGRGKTIWGRLKNNRLVPYHTRKEINRGALRGKAKVILWVDDPVDAFFTQVQGSGRATLDTGEKVAVAYAAKNGRKYTAIGRVLITRGELTRETVSMQSIRKWLADNPRKRDELLETNDGFVFFSLKKDKGPRGSQGVILTAGRSLAIDREFLAHTLPIFLDTRVPVANRDADETYRRLVIAQDTGGAIRGPVRGDIYFGGEPAHADVAGRMKGTGRYFVLLPKSAPPPADFVK